MPVRRPQAQARSNKVATPGHFETWSVHAFSHVKSQLSARSLQNSLRSFHEARLARRQESSLQKKPFEASISEEEVTASNSTSLDEEAEEEKRVLALRDAFEGKNAAPSYVQDDRSVAKAWGLVQNVEDYPKDRRRRSIIKRRVVDEYTNYLIVMDQMKDEFVRSMPQPPQGDACDQSEQLLTYFRNLPHVERENWISKARGDHVAPPESEHGQRKSTNRIVPRLRLEVTCENGYDDSSDVEGSERPQTSVPVRTPTPRPLPIPLKSSIPTPSTFHPNPVESTTAPPPTPPTSPTALPSEFHPHASRARSYNVTGSFPTSCNIEINIVFQNTERPSDASCTKRLLEGLTAFLTNRRTDSSLS